MVMEEYYGSDEQRALLRRGRYMARVLGDDVRYSYYGRTVGLVRPADGSIDQLVALARVQGNSNYSAVRNEEVADVTAALDAQGLVPLHYAKWEGGGSDVTSAARHVVDTYALPADLTMLTMDASTPDLHMASFADMALGCGVLPLCGAVLRGLLQPAVCLYAIDAAGQVVSCAAASAFAHAEHETYGEQAWWGMLATDPSRRSERLALILGAHAVLQMEARFGFRAFMTGVVPGNAPSEAVCTRMGLAAGDHAIVACTDPTSLSGGRMTK